MKNKKIVIISLIVLTVLIGVFLILLIRHNNTKSYDNYSSKDNVSDSNWKKDVIQQSYININDYSKNNCNIEYYSPTFKIENNILYDYNNEKIMEDVFSLYTAYYDSCNVQLLFITTISGQFYYINNIIGNSLKKYQYHNLSDILYVINVYNDIDNNIVVLTNSTDEININSSINSLNLIKR